MSRLIPSSPIHPGDRVEMRKPHPCGGRVWTITRVGSDVGLRCDTCGRRVMLTRSAFNKGLKRLLPPLDPHAPESPSP